jgi:hypothetical protein
MPGPCLFMGSIGVIGLLDALPSPAIAIHTVDTAGGLVRGELANRADHVARADVAGGSGHNTSGGFAHLS